jgi:phosphomannomutase
VARVVDPGAEPTTRPSDRLVAAARAWQAEDPDPATAAELADVLARAVGGDTAAARDLAVRFVGTLQFGTAGLRGQLGAGPNRMNRVVVLRAAAGLAAYLGRRGPTTGLPRPRVVIGYDVRRGSDVFAADSAAVMVGAGIEALVLPSPLPTPVLAFAVRHLRADAGVMVTASHNPPQDNGYKVYLGGPGEEGAQIVPPADAGISAAIDAVGPLADVPRPASGWQTLDRDVVDAYLQAAAAVAPATPGTDRDLRVVVTPLHGVGGETLVEVLRRNGFHDTHVVPEQFGPDGSFPTVAFPNPEEPGAVDLALALARERGADLVIANDPDADRCAVAVHDPAGPAGTGGWRMLRGDEVGALLGQWTALRHTTSRGEDAGGNATLACSIVSSQLLAKVAAHHGLRFAQTLTGFKWIARVPGLVYGYEEALGYCVDPASVRDKDGISAAAVVADLAATLKAQGRTLLDALDDLARRHGLHATDQVSLRVDDLDLITGAMRRLRDQPPAALAGSAVTEVVDLADGADGLPPTDGLRYRTAAGDRVVVRPSGTEPKLKAYLEVVVTVDGDDVAAARAVATERLAELGADVRRLLALG